MRDPNIPRLPIISGRVSPQGGKVVYPVEFRDRYGPAFTQIGDGELDSPVIAWERRALLAVGDWAETTWGKRITTALIVGVLFVAAYLATVELAR